MPARQTARLLSQNAPADTSQANKLDERSADAIGSAAERLNDHIEEAIENLLQGNWQGLADSFQEIVVQGVVRLVPKMLLAAITFAILYAAYRGVDRLLDRVLSHSQRVEAGLQSLIQNVYRAVALIFIGIIVLSRLGVEVTGLVAGLSIAGIAVGFAARDSLENFISGVTILLDEPFKVGDFIVVDDEYGQVDEITLRSTRIRTVRNEVMVLPNTMMITQRVVNHSKRGVLRVDIPFGIAYKEYPEEARQVVLDLADDDDRIRSTPSPSVVVTEMAGSSVNMILRMYLRDPRDEVPLRWEYTEKVREALREADIEVPFPHMQLFLDEAKAFEGTRLMERPGGDGAATPAPRSAPHADEDQNREAADQGEAVGGHTDEVRAAEAQEGAEETKRDRQERDG